MYVKKLFLFIYIIGQNLNDIGNGGKTIQVIMRVFEISGILVSLSYHLDLIRNPCLPSTLGGYLIVATQCGGKFGTDLQATWSLYEILSKSLVLLIALSNWFLVSSGCYFQATLVVLLKSYCMKNYVLRAGQNISRSVSRSNRDNWHTCLIYREIEVMSTEFRRLYCSMIAGVLVSVMLIQTISLYAIVKLGFELPLPMFIVFFTAGSNAVLVLVYMYSSLAEVFTASQNVLEIKLKTGNIHPSPWFRRYLKSCKIIKVFIGSTNYAEPSTPLTVKDFCIGQTISLMLLEN